MNTSQSEHDPSAEQPAALHLEDKNYILALLGKLVQYRLLVSIVLPDNEQRYTTTVLLLDRVSNTLLLDEIFPAAGRAQLASLEQVELHARLEGGELRCSLPLTAVAQMGGLNQYQATVPESIEYTQRRDGHRVGVGSLGVVVEIYAANGMACKGILHDISPRGASIELEDAQTFRNTETYRCTLYPPQEPPFQARLEICCRRSHPGNNKVILGGSFVELDKRGEHILGKLVAELERQLVRGRHRPQAKRDTA